MPVRERNSIATIHNIFFTTLTISVLLPKAVLAYEGHSALPDSFDLAYGVFIALLFFWLGEYQRKYPERNGWYFNKNIIFVTHEFVVAAIHVFRCCRSGHEPHFLPISLRRTGIIHAGEGEDVLTVVTWSPMDPDNVYNIDTYLNQHARRALHPPMLSALDTPILQSALSTRNDLPKGSSEDWDSDLWLMRNTRHDPLSRRRVYNSPTEHMRNLSACYMAT
ncbi:hypothetical protein BD410DRAFT_793365 [Rickenella mellea]|uniref:Uncharacterized protein n=1 Tax=Rickenella mellea TaxID=50990 RepID=A0A4Y7PUQ3_9AGAM|nr:hypothetical protein BD410DRAFT_793365 [Rickenella mellea]